MDGCSRDLDGLHDNELKRFRRFYEAGNITALMSAMCYCERWNLVPPPWVTRAAYTHILEGMKDTPRCSRGRLSTPFKRLRQNMIDHIRWDMVLMVRKHQRELRDAYYDLSRRKGIDQEVRQELLQDLKKELDHFGRSWEDAWVCASMELEGTPAGGSECTMKASYLRVSAALRDPTEAAPYFLPTQQTIRDLGLESLDLKKQG